MEVDTVNVVSLKDGVPVGITSFEDNSRGIISAQEEFIKQCRSIANEPIDSQMVDVILDDEIFESGNYMICIIHSS